MVSLVGSKAILAFCNFLLLACGCTLISGGILILFDEEKVLLSKLLSNGPMSVLPHPLFYYLAIGLASLGLILSTTGVLGCWASCLHNYCILTVYFVIIMVVLIGECAVYAIAWIWPHCLGLGVDSTELTKAMQRNYGTIGEEQFTAAFDLVQTTFKCCGVESANEFDTAMWRLQSISRPSLAVPLTCCILENYNDKAYLNPLPVNQSLCQALEINRHEGYRHLGSCKDDLEIWYKQHYVVFLAVGLVIVLVEFIVLLAVILMCTRVYKYKQETKENDDNNLKHEPKTSKGKNRFSENTYQRRSPLPAYTNDSYALTDSFRQNYRLVDKA